MTSRAQIEQYLLEHIRADGRTIRVALDMPKNTFSPAMAKGIAAGMFRRVGVSGHYNYELGAEVKLVKTVPATVVGSPYARGYRWSVRHDLPAR
jgi:hypothetical protein